MLPGDILYRPYMHGSEQQPLDRNERKRKQPDGLQDVDQAKIPRLELEECQNTIQELFGVVDDSNKQQISKSIVEAIKIAARKNLKSCVNLECMQIVKDMASEMDMANVSEVFYAAWILLGCREKSHLYVENTLKRNWSYPSSLNIEDEHGMTAFQYAQMNNLDDIAIRISEITQRIGEFEKPLEEDVVHRGGLFGKVRRFLRIDE